MLLGSLGLASATGLSSAAPPPSSPVGAIGDNGEISLVVAGLTHTLTDSVTAESLGTSSRSYDIVLETNLPIPLDLVTLSTSPVDQWAGPSQLPGGPDALPALSDWSWTVLHGAETDTSAWTANSDTGQLSSLVAWSNATFTVTGTPKLDVSVEVNPAAANGPEATEPGFVLPGNMPYNDPAYTTLAAALDPGVVRFSETYGAPATWHNSTGTVSFDLTGFGGFMNFTKAVGAQVYLSLPAGSWGDGNLLPAGMPLNTSFLVNYWGHSTGYYPTLTAYRTFLTTFAKDVKDSGWDITYWNIGNEVPVGVSQSTAAAFVTLFNTAAAAIHSVLPDALVGSDVFTWHGKEAYFAGVVHGLGFLAFHDYPATKMCANADTYCAPDNVNGYLTDSRILATSSNYANLPWSTSPQWSQNLWHNLTGQWVPVIDAETNLNSAQKDGSDPRQPTLFNAAWVVSELVDGASQNLSSLLFYSFNEAWPPASSPTESYGGWGFGLISVSASGTNQEYAPYWALDLWASAVPRGAHELPVSDSNDSAVRAFAARSGPDVSVIVANRMDVDATIPISSSNSSWVAVSASTLDDTTYKMVYNTGTHEEQLLASGLGHPSPSEKSSMTLTLDGYGAGVVTFAPVTPVEHTATFSEAGLPSGTDWSVTLDGTTHSSSSSQVTFTELDGSYAYSVPSIAGYTSSPSKGTATVDGADWSGKITFSRLVISYSVAFAESGLPSGTNWSVTLGSTEKTAASTDIDFSVPNGTYDFTVSSSARYIPIPSSGSITVHGASQEKTVVFDPLGRGEYLVKFGESGLALGSTWSVTLGADTQRSNTSEVEFTVANGTYNFSIGAVSGYALVSHAGKVTVNGGGTTLPVTFQLLLTERYSVTFSETGLVTGVAWSVELNFTTQPSTSVTDSFLEPNGSYSYSVGGVSGYDTSAAGGTVLVNGSGVGIPVTFVPFGGQNGSGASGHGGGTGGLGGTPLSWISLGFLGPMVGGAALKAIQVGFAVILVLGITALVIRWPRHSSSRSSSRATRVVRVRTGLQQGFRPPPT